VGTSVEGGAIDDGGETGRTQGIFFGVLLKVVAPVDVRIHSIIGGRGHFAQCNFLKRETFFRGKRVEVEDKKVKKTTPENGKGDGCQHFNLTHGVLVLADVATGPGVDLETESSQ
jgi:hypothetical protein